MNFSASISDEMTHAGLPLGWGLAVWAFMAGVSAWAVLTPVPGKLSRRRFDLTGVPGLGPLIRHLNTRPHVQFAARLVVVVVFVTVIVAGLYGTPIPERNAARC